MKRILTVIILSIILIAYFTVPESNGVDAVASASRVVKDGEVHGNTQFIAEAIQTTAGGDLFAIETIQEYPGDHDGLTVSRDSVADAEGDVKEWLQSLGYIE